MAAQDNLARKPIYIPATQPEEELSLRVAAYCRVSSDSDDQLKQVSHITIGFWLLHVKTTGITMAAM